MPPDVLLFPPVLVLRPAFAKVAKAKPGQGCVEMSFGVIRIELERVDVAFKCLLKPRDAAESIAAIDVCGDEFWVHAERPVMAGQRLLKPVQESERDAAVGQTGGVIGLDRQ